METSNSQGYAELSFNPFKAELRTMNERWKSQLVSAYFLSRASLSRKRSIDKAMVLIADMEKKNIKINEDYFEITEKEEEDNVVEKVEECKAVNIKIDEDYIKPNEESLEGKETTFSEDETELKSRVKKLERELAAITVPGFTGMWKAHSSAFNDYEIRSEDAFRAGSLLSIGRTASEGKPRKLLTKLEKRSSEYTARDKKGIGEEMCKSVDVEEEEC